MNNEDGPRGKKWKPLIPKQGKHPDCSNVEITTSRLRLRPISSEFAEDIFKEFTAEVTHSIAAFLKKHRPGAEDSAEWGGGQLSLRIASYISEEQPLLEYVTSVRCVLLKGDSVLVVQSTDGTYHILPGGRREEGESVEETLRREILEEAGWTIKDIEFLGFVHFHHLKPKPEGYPYPHPDFFQLVFLAQADAPCEHRKIQGDWEQDSGFRPVGDTDDLSLSASDELYLQVAMERR